MHTIGVFAHITNKEGQILLVRQNYAGLEWACAGGRLEKGEDLVAGLHREVWEEAKCIITVNRMIGTYIAPYANDLVVFFDASLKEAHPWQPDDEISDMGFFDSNRLPSPMSAGTKLRIADALEGRTGVVATYAKSNAGVVSLTHEMMDR